jgi:DNA topoisomerase-1
MVVSESSRLQAGTPSKNGHAQAPPERALPADPVDSARAAGLRYVRDDAPGIRREREGDGFVYTSPDGGRVDDDETLRRIRSLAVPPAWTDVWICAAPRGHLQATGRDARGRKQYRYHPRWRAARDETKYERMLAFGRALPAIRERVEQDLRLPDMPREKVLATVVRLLETTLVRVGNEEYARANHSFGLTTMRYGHATTDGAEVRFHFRGKSGKSHHVGVRDRRVARIIRRLQDMPGQELFQYEADGGELRSVDSSDVNEYLREISGQEFTAKEFRTWAGTVLAALALDELEQFDSETQAKRNVVRAIESVAERLGNTPAVCRKCYIHPAVIESYMDGETLRMLRERAAELDLEAGGRPPHEAAVLALLEERLEAEAPRAKAS